ncbi:hypothetical protein TIFTF001_034282 [Ficus carica]|uniref:Uncharacterized protein n=1 Tax=Ficus carica TaxID=3494 RepID=A0AA88DZL5_FICCA|nr:hypothetical protein TIFTF001_034282 [Ficus carica]
MSLTGKGERQEGDTMTTEPPHQEPDSDYVEGDTALANSNLRMGSDPLATTTASHPCDHDRMS